MRRRDAVGRVRVVPFFGRSEQWARFIVPPASARRAKAIEEPPDRRSSFGPTGSGTVGNVLGVVLREESLALALTA
jgi:hypothetical protein